MNKDEEIIVNINDSDFLEEESLLITNDVKEQNYPLFSKINIENEMTCYDEKYPKEKNSVKKPKKSKPLAFEFIDFKGNSTDKDALILEKLKSIRQSMEKIKEALDISTISTKKQTIYKPMKFSSFA